MNPQTNKSDARRRAVALRRGAFAGLLLAILAAPAWASSGKNVEELRPLAADGSVLIENEFGEIVIQGWDRNEVRISGGLSDDVNELEIRESGNTLRIRVDYHHRRTIDGADLEIMVPEGASVTAESVSGDIEAGGLAGQMLELRTVSGDLDVAARVQRVSLHSVSGDIDFSGTASRISAESVSGEIDLTGVSGEIDASTVSGDITVTGDTLSSGEFEAVSGDVELRVALADGGRINVSSMSGDIDLYLPKGQQAEFQAQTFSGSIDSAFGQTRDSSSQGPGKRLKHHEGNSGATINLNSFSGDVSIYKR